MTEPKVSVIIPIYNTEKYLPQCLDSIINQTFKGIEIICINDGSTDNSSEILNEYSNLDSRIKIVTKENDGLGPARNTGIQHACTDLFCFVDSDDYLYQDAIESLYLAHEKTNADIIVARATLFNNDTNRKICSRGWDKHLKPTNNIFNKSDCPDTLYQLINQMTHAKLFCKKVIDENNLSFHKCKMHEDLTFVYSYIACCNSIYLLDKDVYMYRTARKHSLVQLNKKDPDSRKEFDVAFEKLKDNLVQFGCYELLHKSYLNSLIITILGHLKNISIINKLKLIKHVRQNYKFLKELDKEIVKENIYYTVFKLLFGWVW